MPTLLVQEDGASHFCPTRVKIHYFYLSENKPPLFFSLSRQPLSVVVLSLALYRHSYSSSHVVQLKDAGVERSLKY